ncbi:MAG: preprotein translocase subunit SecE [Chlamydiales bacterium]|nr:preprotein translocase subunit SecE [Chlamydiales bacterium]
MSAAPKLKLVKQKAKKMQREGFVNSTKAELKKVCWTTKAELKKCTKVVILSTFIFGFGIYCVDLIIRGALGGLTNVLSWFGV